MAVSSYLPQPDDFNLWKNTKSLFVSDQNQRLTLDAWRALAMFWIITQHMVLFLMIYARRPDVMRKLLEDVRFAPFLAAHLSVDIFFVISGFLIGGIVYREKFRTGTISLGRFWARRFLRMLPVFYAMLIVTKLFAYFGWLDSSYLQESAWPNFLYVVNFVTVGHQFFSHTWSLAIEEQFYLFLPLLMLFLPASRRVWVAMSITMIAVCVGLHAAIVNWGPPDLHWRIFRELDVAAYDSYFDLLYDKPYVRFSALFIGVLGYVAHANGWAQRLFKTRLLSLFSLSIGICLIALVVGQTPLTHFDESWMTFGYEIFYREAFSVGTLLLIFATLYVQPLNRLFGLRFFYPFFQLSYGIYLCHLVIVGILMGVVGRSHYVLLDFDSLTPWHILGLATVTFLVSGLVAAVFFVLVERPFMNLRARLFDASLS